MHKYIGLKYFSFRSEKSNCSCFTKAGITDHFGMNVVLFNLKAATPTVTHYKLFKKLRKFKHAGLILSTSHTHFKEVIIHAVYMYVTSLNAHMHFDDHFMKEIIKLLLTRCRVMLM